MYSVANDSRTAGRYLAGAFTSYNRSRISVVFVARMQPSDDPGAKPPITQPEVLFTVRGLPAGTPYLASAFAIRQSVSNAPTGGAPVIVTSDDEGVLRIPHSYGSTTPCVLHIKLEQQQQQQQQQQLQPIDHRLTIKTDDNSALCPNRSSLLRLATQKYKSQHHRGNELNFISSGTPAANRDWPERRNAHGFKWQNSSFGVHSWLVFDYDVSSANATALARNFDFIWGSSPHNAPAWRKGSSSIIVSRYINGNRDSTANAGNLTWWRIHHPSWVMWTCKNSTGQRTVAWSDGDVDVPLDWSNQDVVRYQLAAYTCGCYVCPCAPADPGGYNAIAVDGYHFANFGHACGHYDRDWTDPDAKFVEQYTTDGPAGGRWGDPRYTVDGKTWLARFYAGLQAMPTSVRPLLILNFDLA